MSARAKVARSPPPPSSSASSRAASNGPISTSPAPSGPTRRARSTTRAPPASAWPCSIASWRTISRGEGRLPPRPLPLDGGGLGWGWRFRRHLARLLLHPSPTPPHQREGELVHDRRLLLPHRFAAR